jgi:hypothetical protein
MRPLVDTRAIAPHRRRRRRQLHGQAHALEHGALLERLGRDADVLAQVERLQAQGQLAVHDARQVEQVVDQADLVADVPVDRLEGPGRHVVDAGVPPEDLGPADDRLERGAQLVRERRDELVLQPARVLGRPARRLHRGEGTLLVGDVLPRDDGGVHGAVRPA